MLDQYTKYQLVDWNKKLTNVIVEDIFTPPVCSRIYAYPNIAAYEVLAADDDRYPSFSSNLKGFEDIPPPGDAPVYYPLAAGVAFALVAQQLVYGQEKIEKELEDYLSEVKGLGLSGRMYEASKSYGTAVANHILTWAGQDGYLERTAQTDYIVTDELGRWTPTPPDYMPAIEPHWNTLRTFVIDSSSQFTSLGHTPFDTSSTSAFYKETIEVYDAVNNLDEEKLEIAKFWDCNPNVSNTRGHLMFFDQKISPGGHWVSIASQVVLQAEKELMEGARIMALTTITLADAFISCWDEKYKTALVRPETYINEYIDAAWKPVLQTPAFPEYTSGHSVISSAAATMLTEIMGDNIAFQDSTELQWGLPIRSFDSFYDAADEAAISRLYGGIHYMPAISNGVSQGKDLGRHIIGELSPYIVIGHEANKSN